MAYLKHFKGLIEVQEGGPIIRDIVKAAGLDQHFHDGIKVSGKRTNVNPAAPRYTVMQN